ncbi:MAG: ATP-binding cassette domain-containing protein [Oscillospiraceae bacterium]|nr:ATP-binding cassette domain-containing protein [Oscillospiraceae bacterium]
MIQVENLQKSYDGRRVLDRFSLTLPDSGVVCLAGASGRGKTTLLRLLSGLEQPDSGSVEGLAGRKMAFVFQEDRLLPWVTAAQNIRLAQPPGAKRPVQDLLALAGLDLEGKKYPDQLSGGQRRRVAFLRGIAFLEGAADGVLLLDEPFNGLDADASEKICRMIRDLPPQTLTVLVSHQLAPLNGLEASFFSMEEPV